MCSPKRLVHSQLAPTQLRLSQAFIKKILLGCWNVDNVYKTVKFTGLIEILKENYIGLVVSEFLYRKADRHFVLLFNDC